MMDVLSPVGHPATLSDTLQLCRTPCNSDEKIVVFAQWPETVAAVAAAVAAAAHNTDAGGGKEIQPFARTIHNTHFFVEQ